MVGGKLGQSSINWNVERIVWIIDVFPFFHQKNFAVELSVYHRTNLHLSEQTNCVKSGFSFKEEV